MQTSLRNLLSLLLAVPGVVCAGNQVAKTDDVAKYVNPFIGASTNTEAAGSYHGLGKTFPGAATPFGMVQVSPNTISGGDHAPGYSYEHKTIEGFALTQMSGVGWYGELGNFLVMPTNGDFRIIAGKENGEVKGYRSSYDKSSEYAAAGYYSVNLEDYGIRAETSATPHCGIMRFTFPDNQNSRIQVDLAHRVGGTAEEEEIHIIDNSTFCGRIHCTPECGGWGDGDGKVEYTLYFYGKLSRPVEEYGFWSADIPDNASRHHNEVNTKEYLENIAASKIIKGQKDLKGKHIGFFMEFPTKDRESVELTVGVSFVDVEGAKNNYMAEINNKDFDTVRKEAYNLWNKEFGRVKIEGGSDDDKTVFYTALYHTMIDPRLCSDVDGRYVGGDKKIKTTGKIYNRRTIFSGWDVFRSQFPLQNIINPTLVNDQINSLIDLASESGNRYFERWELLNAYSGCMLGNPAVVVIADAYAKGIRNFDVGKALEYAVNSSEKFGLKDLDYCPEPTSVSNTLEYAYSDWCTAQLAKALAKRDIADVYTKKAQSYRNVFNKEVGWFCPRNADGTWCEWNPETSLTEDWFGCMECNLIQQGWFVPHDVPGMVELMGGKERVVATLDTMFARTPRNVMWNSYYNHANEPVHFVPFLYNKLGEPWKTQEQTRHICKDAYSNRVEGLVGNEDVGQMSAWYVLASTGVHPSCPGETRMEITSPIFDKVEYRLDPSYHQGKTFTILATGNSPENVYIHHAKLNGKPYNKCYIDFADIANGGTLELFMSSTPNKSWGLD